MNLAEALLAVDAGKIKERATKEIEIPRLSKIFGEPFVVEIKQIPAKRFREINETAYKLGKDGRPESVDSYNLQVMILCDGITNRDFDNKEVLNRFKAATRKDLFQIIFNAGEIAKISDEISALCGFGGEAVKDKTDEVKN